jgi:hypothetical protein
VQRPVLVFWKREKFCSRRMPRGFLIWKRYWRVFPAARFDDCKVFKEMANPVTSSSSGHRTTKCPPCPLGKNADGTKMKGHETAIRPLGEFCAIAVPWMACCPLRRTFIARIIGMENTSW